MKHAALTNFTILLSATTLFAPGCGIRQNTQDSERDQKESGNRQKEQDSYQKQVSAICANREFAAAVVNGQTLIFCDSPTGKSNGKKNLKECEKIANAKGASISVCRTKPSFDEVQSMTSHHMSDCSISPADTGALMTCDGITTDITHGPQGEQGKKGISGERGLRGEKGETGENGDRGEMGISGTEIGAKGEKGAQGMRGDQGVQGEKGETGKKGPPGPRGEPGEPGVRGDPGGKGPTGHVQGPGGIQGPKGVQGKKGEDGICR